MSMLMYELTVPLVEFFPLFNRYDADAIDRLNHKYSSIIFTAFSLIVAAHQYIVGEVIKCWTPAEFPVHWVEYADSICWSSNTYYIPLSETNILEAQTKEVVYYQWVPVVLAMLGFMFLGPLLFWKAANKSVGIDPDMMVRILSREIELRDYLNPEWRDLAVAKMAKHIDRVLAFVRKTPKTPLDKFKKCLAKRGCYFGKRYGNYLVFSYMVTKLLYISNVCFQIYLLHHFLGINFLSFGFDVLSQLVWTGEYIEIKRFPKVTMCDFRVRTLGRNHHHSVQCTLPANLFNEKTFIFIWFWLVFLLVANIFGMCVWISKLFISDSRKYVTGYLKLSNKYVKASHKAAVADFCNVYLQPDGYFMLRLIEKNTNQVLAGELTECLWSQYRHEEDLESIESNSSTESVSYV